MVQKIGCANIQSTDIWKWYLTLQSPKYAKFLKYKTIFAQNKFLTKNKGD